MCSMLISEQDKVLVMAQVAEQEHEGLLPRGYILGNYQIEQWRVDDGSFVKLREVALSYNLGNLKFFKDVVLSLSGRNLIIMG